MTKAEKALTKLVDLSDDLKSTGKDWEVAWDDAREVAESIRTKNGEN